MKLNTCLLLLVSLLLITGCTESTVETPTPEATPTPQDNVPMDTGEATAAVAGLAAINDNLGTGMESVGNEFDDFDSDFGVNVWFYTVITDSFLADMDKSTKAISDGVNDLSEGESRYNALMDGVDKETLSAGDSALAFEIDNKINSINTEKAKVLSCVEEMGNYREFMRLVQQDVIVSDRLSTEQNLLDNYVNGEEYDKALTQISQIQKTILEHKENAEAREELKIQGPLEGTIEAWSILHDAYDVYKEYVTALKKNQSRTADDKIVEYNNKLSEAAEAEDPNASSATYQFNLIDQWYSKNIGVCIDVFSD